MKPERVAAYNGIEIQPDRTFPVYSAEDLTAGKTKAVIILKDQQYTLQITKQGKLLLTK